jgi:RNA polymerase sigma factor (sigma-70 family)
MAMSSLEHSLAGVLARARDLEVDAWQSLVDRYRDRLAAVVRRKTPDYVLARVDADDVLQEILLAACRGFSHARFEAPRDFEVWLLKVARNTVVDVVRRVVSEKRGFPQRAFLRSSPTALDRVMAEISSPSRALQRREAQLVARRILERLGPRHRHVLELIHLDRMKTSEVAEVLGISQAAVRKRLERALAVSREVAGHETW